MTPAIADHLELAKEFIRRSRGYLDAGDLHQAAEKGWGAAAHTMKAVAAANGWEYNSHDDFYNIVTNAREKYRQPSLQQMSRSATALHTNFYQRRMFLNADVIREDIDNVEKMVSILEPFIT